MSISRPLHAWPRLMACTLFLGLLLGSATLLWAGEPLENNSRTLAFDKIIKGRITDGSNGNPPSGASVTVKGPSVSALTDGQGNFYISVADDKAVLGVSFVGYF